MTMRHAPNKWLATLLGVLVTPIAFLYVGRARWAAVYLLAQLALAMCMLFSVASPAVLGAVNLAYLGIGAAHAHWLARRSTGELPRPWYSRWHGLLAAFLAFVAVILSFRAFAYEPFRQPSSSMLPTIPRGAALVVQKWGYGNYGTFGRTLVRRPISEPMARGDIVVFEFPGNRSIQYVKRVVGLPGDKISYRRKTLFLNDVPVPQHQAGETIDEETLVPRSVMSESLAGREYSVIVDQTRPEPQRPALGFPLREQCTLGPDELSCRVPAGHFFMLGDNRDNSNDSRYWGFVPADHIVGKLVSIGR
jgi:signal peptidase I